MAILGNERDEVKSQRDRYEYNNHILQESTSSKTTDLILHTIGGIIVSFFKKKLIIGMLTLLAVIGGVIYWQSDGIPVLNYHLVNKEKLNALSITPEQFDEQMAYLHKNGYTTISPDQLLDYLQDNKPLPEKPILITFDDGYQDTYTEAYPILKKYNFTATVFLVTDYVGNSSRYITWEQVKEMHNNGFTFGSHTLSHVSLSKITNEEAEYQLVKSREAIEWRIKKPVKYFAHPGGFYNQTTSQLLQKSGYRAAFTVNLGRAKADNDVFAMKRIPIFESANVFRSFWLRLKFTQLVVDIGEVKKIISKH